MSKRSQEKRQARSKEKKLARRRMMGMSPLSRLAGTAEETCECWMTCSEDQRMISLHVMRPVRGGQMAGAFFLVDCDCIGLKDAFYRLDIDPAHLREILRGRSEAEGMRVLRVDLAEVRRLVAGALRWTRAHPFRVPADAERCLKIIGGVGDIEQADIGDFGDENGNLYYIGRQIDLVKRLQGIELEEFMNREDVKCIFQFGDESFDDAGDWDEEDDEYEEDEDDGFDPMMTEEEELDPEAVEDALREMQERLKRHMIDHVRRWCFAQAVAPHPELESAVDILVASAGAIFAGGDDAAALARSRRAQEVITSFADPERQAGLAAARAQLAQCMKSFPSQAAFLAAMQAERP